MKYLLIIMLLTTNNVRAQEINWQRLLDGNSIASYSLFFAGGFSDGLNDCVIANKFYYADFWGYSDWQKHGNFDAFHATKLATPIFYSAAIAINIGGEKQNWKYYVAKGLICFAASRLGHELCYQVIFKNYPK